MPLLYFILPQVFRRKVVRNQKTNSSGHGPIFWNLKRRNQCHIDFGRGSTGSYRLQQRMRVVVILSLAAIAVASATPPVNRGLAFSTLPRIPPRVVFSRPGVCSMSAEPTNELPAPVQELCNSAIQFCFHAYSAARLQVQSLAQNEAKPGVDFPKWERMTKGQSLADGWYRHDQAMLSMMIMSPEAKAMKENAERAAYLRERLRRRMQRTKAALSNLSQLKGAGEQFFDEEATASFSV